MKLKSIMTIDDDRCFICGRYGDLECHHIFGGANRQNSTKYGLVVPLCHTCHNEPPDGVHFNLGNRLSLQARGQRAFESIQSHQAFMDIFGEDYIEQYEEYVKNENNKH